jgi:hypothetical protein
MAAPPTLSPPSPSNFKRKAALAAANLAIAPPLLLYPLYSYINTHFIIPNKKYDYFICEAGSFPRIGLRILEFSEN